jgi:hypothetical protein
LQCPLRYAVGGILISAGAGGVGFMVVLYTILRDWRFWLAEAAAFTKGFWST